LPRLHQILVPRKIDVRLPGKGNSNSHGARPVHLIITMIKWVRTSRLSIKTTYWSVSGGISKSIEVLENSSFTCPAFTRSSYLAHQSSSGFRIQGGLVFKVHRLCVSLNSRLESNKEEEEEPSVPVTFRLSHLGLGYPALSTSPLNPPSEKRNRRPRHGEQH